MHLTIGKPADKESSSVLRQHLRGLVIAGAGAILTLRAIGGFSGQLTSTGAAPAPRSSYTLPDNPFDKTQSPLKAVRVATVEEQELLQARFEEDQFSVEASGQPTTNLPIVVVKGSALDASLTSASGDVAGSGTSVQVTDETVQATPGTSSK